MEDSLRKALSRLDQTRPVKHKGRVTDLTGLVIKATLPDARFGDHARILRQKMDPLIAEVIGFSQQKVLLMPLGYPDGVGSDSLVEGLGGQLVFRCGPPLLGHILDGLGRPLDGSLPQGELEQWPVERAAPDPLDRQRIRRPLSLGLRAIDGLSTIGEGQRIGLFAGSGVGKSTLLGQIARNTEADITVIGLVGERGREVREFIEESLKEGLQRSVVVCATSDSPPMVRLKSASVATAVAEYFRAQGARVLLLMDSITRYARALREVGLAAGEPPVRRGYPPSVFACLPRLLERAGTSTQGSITAIYTVLVEGGDLEEPIADEVRGILDGHIVLSRQLAQRGHWPAIDILRSLSRLMPSITNKAHQKAAQKLRQVLSTYEQQRDLILLGAYKNGSDPETDYALKKIQPITQYLQQDINEETTLDQTQKSLLALFHPA